MDDKYSVGSQCFGGGVRLFSHLTRGVIHLCMAGEQYVELNLWAEYVIISPPLGF